MKINICVKATKSGETGYMEIEATVSKSGYFGIHLPVEDTTSKGWVVTHIPSGLNTHWNLFKTLKDAEKYVEDLEGTGYEGWGEPNSREAIKQGIGTVIMTVYRKHFQNERRR